MEKQKNTQMLVIAILSVALLTMSVGFAIVSADILNINGTVDVGAQQWKIAFNSTTYAEATGSKTVTPTITESTMTFDVKLAEVGDFYEFDIDVENLGTFDAELVSMTVSDLSAYSDYLKLEATYDGTASGNISGNPVLNKKDGTKDTATVHVKLSYFQPEDASKLPAEDVDDIPVTISLNYRQKTS